MTRVTVPQHLSRKPKKNWALPICPRGRLIMYVFLEGNLLWNTSYCEMVKSEEVRQYMQLPLLNVAYCHLVESDL